MPTRPMRPCSHPGCRETTIEGTCPTHSRERQRDVDRQRGTANHRGYTYRWGQYSKWFLKQPGNEICKLRIDKRCNILSECVDHIKPPGGADDPLFWDEMNHQASCLICNSIKGDRVMYGDEWRV